MAQTELNSTEVPTQTSFITDLEMATEMMTENSTELGDSMTTNMPPTDANIPENSSSTLKTTVTSIAMTTNQTTMAPGTTLNTKSATDKTETETPVTTDAKQITMAPGTTSTTKSTTDKTGPETPVVTDANQIITAPGTSSTRKSPTDQMEAGTSDAPDATISPKSTEGIRSTKTSMKAPTPKDQSSGAPTDKVKPSPNHSYTGAIVGLFIFLVATGVLFVAIYLVRRRKLRNNYGRLEEDTEGDGGWSAFSKNPIYRGDKDYQLL